MEPRAADELAFPLVVGSVLEDDAEATARRLREAHPGAGLLELRGDRLPAEAIAGLIRSTPRPTILTLRRPPDGDFRGSESERRDLLLAGLEAGARFVDVEFDGELRDLAEGEYATRVILSHHGASCRLDALRTLHSEMAPSRAALLKIVPRVTSVAELTAIKRFLKQAKDDRLTCFPVGETGSLARLLTCAWGGWGSYGAVRAGRESAVGQLDLQCMLDLQRVTTITAETRLFLLVGGSVGGSPSPAMHGAAYRARGLDARYFSLDLQRFEDLIDLAEEIGIEGVAVTMPFKEAAAASSVARDAVARAARAVNTLVLGRGGGEAWAGYNTDGPAALRLLRERCEIVGAKVAVRGAGGTARAIAAALKAAGARVTLCNRTRTRGERVAKELGVAAAAVEDWGRGNWPIRVNATPEAGRPDPEPSGDGKLILDAVYGAEPTGLAVWARERGLQFVDGFELLLEQAVLQFERLSGAVADREVMRAAGLEWMRSRGGPER